MHVTCFLYRGYLVLCMDGSLVNLKTWLRQERGAGTFWRQKGFWDKARHRGFTWEDVRRQTHGT